MKIEKIRVYAVGIPLSEPFYPVWIPGYPQMHNNFYLVELTTDTGIKGYSAATRFANEAKGAIEMLGGFLLGRDPLSIEEILSIFRSAAYIGIRLYWIEPALWDIKGKDLGLSLFKMFGGSEEKIKAYASTGELHKPEVRAEEVIALRAQGFKAVKLRVHSENIKDDLKIVKKVKEAVGDTIEIMVDANQAWRIEVFGKVKKWSLDDALYFVDALSSLGIKWLEEPLDMHDFEGLSSLRKKSKIPLAGGEMNFGLPEFEEFINHQSLDILQPDATLSGGMTLSKEVISLVEKNNLKFSPHTWTNGIGLLINLSLLGAYSQDKILEYPLEPPGWTPQVRDGILKKPILVDREGYVSVPTEPGIGVDIDEERLKKFSELIYEV